MTTGSAHNTNYASILEAGSPFVREIETRQQDHINMWLRLYWMVIWFNWRIGRFGSISWEDLKASINITLTPPQVDVRDRNSETNRNILLRDKGVISDRELAAREGVDYDEQQRLGAKEKEQEVENTGDGGEVNLDDTRVPRPMVESEDG